VHFDDKQFESNRQDGRKLLCPYATPNLLRKCIAEEEKTKENTAKKAKYFKHIQDLQSRKFYMKQSQREQKVKMISI